MPQIYKSLGVKISEQFLGKLQIIEVVNFFCFPCAECYPRINKLKPCVVLLMIHINMLLSVTELYYCGLCPCDDTKDPAGCISHTYIKLDMIRVLILMIAITCGCMPCER